MFRSFTQLAFVIVAILANICSARAEVIVLENAIVIDMTGAAPMVGMDVVLEDGLIAGIYSASKYSPPPEARIINLEGAYLLPGLWNNHSHLADLLPDPLNILEDEPFAPALIRAGRNAMDALRAGFTSLRMTGERDYIDVHWKAAFETGVFVGPRIYPSGAPIAAPGGHGTEGVGPAASEVMGVEQITAEVHARVENGAEVVKIMVDELSAAEIRAAIDAAHDLDVKIVGHAAEPGAGIAVEAGIDGIEHGYMLKDETIALMAEKGVFYDPTIVCNLSAHYIDEREAHITGLGLKEDPTKVEGRILVAYADERTQTFAERQRRILQKASKAGVKIISGSDSNPIDEIGILEIEQLVLSGLTEMEALQAATRNSAEMMGVLDRFGTIETDKVADLIVVEKDPLENISHLRMLNMVFKNGLPVDISPEEGRASFWSLYFFGAATSQ